MAAYGRKTHSLEEALKVIAFELGGEAGARPSTKLGGDQPALGDLALLRAIADLLAAVNRISGSSRAHFRGFNDVQGGFESS
jgi:hypothetical protein